MKILSQIAVVPESVSIAVGILWIGLIAYTVVQIIKGKIR